MSNTRAKQGSPNLSEPGGGGVGGGGVGGGGGCGSDGAVTTMCLIISPHACTINSGGRTPGSKLPASPPPLLRPNGGGQPWPCACAHGPKNSDPSTSQHGHVDTLPKNQRQLRRIHSLLHCQDYPVTCRCTTTSMSTNPCPQAVSAYQRLALNTRAPGPRRDNAIHAHKPYPQTNVWQ